MNKFTAPRIDKKYIRYAVQIMKKDRTVCWVTHFESTQIGTEKGQAKIMDEADASLCHLRLAGNGIIAFIVKMQTGTEPVCVNKEDVPYSEYMDIFGN